MNRTIARKGSLGKIFSVNKRNMVETYKSNKITPFASELL